MLHKYLMEGFTDYICSQMHNSKENFVDHILLPLVNLKKVEAVEADYDLDSQNLDYINAASFNILLKCGKAVNEYLNEHTDLASDKTFLVETNKAEEIRNHHGQYNAIINLSVVNNHRYINKFFEVVNSKLQMGDTFIGCFETYSAKRNRKRVHQIPVIGILYAISEFIWKRVFPKILVLKNIYFSVTKGRNRMLSKAEVLGRLVCCGFEIKDFNAIGALTYFIVEKVKQPTFDMHPSYGPLYKMPRLGKNGKIIGVYKLRTMHPYAEYLQDYVLRKNDYAESGKPAQDFRLTPWAKVIRKYWIDEVPQLLNVIKGDLKLVGVRPVSKRYFQDIPEDLQKLRLTQKPGCIPPYVSLNRKGSVESVLQSEREYLLEKNRNPFTTDIKYFFWAMYNIVVKKKRSA